MPVRVTSTHMDDDHIRGRRTNYRKAIEASNGDGEAAESEPAEPVADEEPEAGAENEPTEPVADEEPDAEPEPEAAVEGASEAALTIALPDGSENVAEAMAANRRMLSNPAENGLAAAEELDELREAVEALSGAVPDELDEELATLEASVDEVADGLDRQQRQIQELSEVVTRLAEILGASVEFQSVDTE